jgi:hypothetical protein
MEVGTPPLHLIAPVFLRYFRAEFAISSLFLVSYKVIYFRSTDNKTFRR